MTLGAVVAAMSGATLTGDPATEVTGLALDSRRVRQGDLFFALAGQRADGARFARAAIDAGAVAIVGEGRAEESGTPVVRVSDARLAMAQAARVFHGDPARDLRIVAVTGTNGKTTTTWLLESVFAAASWRSGVIGTTGIRVAGQTRPSAFTTPESPDLFALLAEMRGAAVQAVALEASSHALVQKRTYGLAVDAAVFTNLTQDHLDYHGTMEAYQDAKCMLFDGRNGGDDRPSSAILNADDPASPAFADAARRGRRAVTRFGESRDAELRIAAVRASARGLAIGLSESGASVEFTLPLLGRYNAWNAAGAWGAARALGVPADAVRLGLEHAPQVPGRLERVDAGQPFDVVVDYAHTPDALGRSLEACRDHASGRVLLVFGCGGDRDRGKRPKMGALAARLADRAWVTNDNPRHEDPAHIALEIVAGAGAAELAVVLDRRAAIAEALGGARPGDLVLIAGKGHETTQTIGDQVLPFVDRDVAREWLLSHAGGAPS